MGGVESGPLQGGRPQRTKACSRARAGRGRHSKDAVQAREQGPVDVREERRLSKDRGLRPEEGQGPCRGARAGPRDCSASEPDPDSQPVLCPGKQGLPRPQGPGATFQP